MWISLAIWLSLLPLNKDWKNNYIFLFPLFIVKALEALGCESEGFHCYWGEGKGEVWRERCGGWSVEGWSGQLLGVAGCCRYTLCIILFYNLFFI